MLSDREFFLSCNPHLAKFEALKLDTPPEEPECVQAKGRRGDKPTEAYSVTDIVHAMPAGLWDTNVVSTYEFTDVQDGVVVRIKSPLSIVMDTMWEIKTGEDGGLELVEGIVINCSRLLAGVVKNECESGWQKIHAKMLGRLEGEVKS